MQRDAGGRTSMVAEAIRKKIAARVLTAGEKLPSIRGFAAVMRVSPSTVVDAYDRLAADGLIHARRGAGFYVAGAAPLAVTPAPPRDREIDPLWVSRQSLDAGADMLKPGCGWLPASWMPNAAIRRAVRRLGKAPDDVLAEYGSTRGSFGLRRLLARQFAAEGCPLGADQLLLTASGSQSLDLICRALLRPGDTVLLDDPCYFNFQALLRVHQARVISVPYTPSGPDLAHFEQALTAYRPRLYVTTTALQNPTGATLSPHTAHRLLNLAATHDLTVVEDSLFADLEPDPSPRLAALDGFSRVIRIGSFSKTLSASIRCGYVGAHTDLIEALTDLQIATGFGGPSPALAELVAGTLGDGSYRKHLQSLRARLSRARREAGAKLEGLGIKPWIAPRGGFYLWCRFPDGLDTTQIARAALRANVVLAPGNVFSLSQSAADLMRFNVAQMGDPRVFEVLAQAMREQTG